MLLCLCVHTIVCMCVYDGNTKLQVTGIEGEMERTKSLLRTLACK